MRGLIAPEDHAVFADRGLLRLPGCAPTAPTSAARKAILDELERLGARVDGKWHTAKVPRTIRHLPAFDDVVPRALVARLDRLAGRALQPAQPHPQILLTPPQRGPWSVPQLGWHLDVAAPVRDEIPGIQVFVLVDDVAPGGGGTVALSGSHKLHGATGAAPVNAHQVLRADPIFEALFSPRVAPRASLLEPHPVAGVTVQLVEMWGRAGDVYVMDMRVVHAASMNTSKRARMMLTCRYLVPG